MSNCVRCGAAFPVNPPGHVGGAGYASCPDGKVCYGCCAEEDRDWMREKGAHGGLYLTKGDDGRYRVTNWPGSLSFPASVPRRWKGRGFGGSYPCEQARFTFEGQPWTIRVQGDMQLGRARRLRGAA